MEKSFGHYVDLTHVVDNATPAFPGDPNPHVIPVYTVEKDGFRVEKISLGSHTATHVDAPAHVFGKGMSVADIAIEMFEGIARVADVLGDEVTPCEIDRAIGQCQHVDWLIIRTGWGKFWSEPKTYFKGSYPHISEQTAKYIAQLGLKGVAMDTPGPDAYGADSLIAHRVLLEHSTLIVENLANVEKLPVGKDIYFSAWPMKLACRDAAPVRAVARF